MIALINARTISRHGYVKVVSIASSTSLQDDDGALKKGVELAHVKNDGVEEMSKSQKGASRGPGPALHLASHPIKATQRRDSGALSQDSMSISNPTFCQSK